MNQQQWSSVAADKIMDTIGSDAHVLAAKAGKSQPRIHDPGDHRNRMTIKRHAHDDVGHHHDQNNRDAERFSPLKVREGDAVGRGVVGLVVAMIP